MNKNLDIVPVVNKAVGNEHIHKPRWMYELPQFNEGNLEYALISSSWFINIFLRICVNKNLIQTSIQKYLIK